MGNYKIIKFSARGRSEPNSSNSNWDGTEWKLFNLDVDPGEHNDLASENPDLLNQLISEWENKNLLLEYINHSKL
jgi:hypothetical protein